MFFVRLLKWCLEFLLALVILFEEWGWDPLKRLMLRIMSLPLLLQIDRGISRLPPYAALAVLLLPSLFLVPVKLAALWLVHRGHVGAGLAIILCAKVAGTAVVAHFFHLTQPALMKLSWFARLYTRWTEWKESLLARVRSSWSYKRAVELKKAVVNLAAMLKFL